MSRWNQVLNSLPALVLAVIVCWLVLMLIDHQSRKPQPPDSVSGYYTFPRGDQW